MADTHEDRRHFTQAIAQMGEHRDVVAARPIFNLTGMKIVDKGAAINLSLYERLTQHRLSAPIEDSVVSADAVNGEGLRQAADAIMEESPFFGRLAADALARKSLLNVIETVPLPEAMALQLTVARDVRPEIFLHLLRTALVATWLAARPGMVSRYQLGMAAAAGLLHDIGMLHVDPVLLQPTQRLDRDQRRQLYSHPLVSSALVERHHQYPREVLRAVAEHQEYLDGSGYPRNLSGDAISGLGRLVCLAQAVSAMFAPGRSAPEMQLSVLLRLNTQRFDPALAAQVLAIVQPQRDVLSAAVARLEDPVRSLGEIDAILGQLPLRLDEAQALPTARSEGLARVAKHGLHLRRTLAGVGAVPDQLALLGEAVGDEAVQTELTLLAHEAGWQLRTLGREARRRWRTQAGETYPAAMQQWLDRIDTVVASINGIVVDAPSDPKPSHLPQAKSL